MSHVVRLPKLVSLCALAIATSFAAGSTASAATSGKPLPSAFETTFTVSWTQEHMDSSGNVLWTRSGTAADKPTSSLAQSPANKDAGAVTPDACCSSSGSDTVDVTITWSGILGQTLAVFHHRVYWEWSYPRITGVNVSCYATNVDQFVNYDGCGGGGNYYQWAGSAQGGHYSFRQGTFRNCLPGLGCIANAYPWIKIWVNGNGAWTSSEGW